MRPGTIRPSQKLYQDPCLRTRPRPLGSPIWPDRGRRSWELQTAWHAGPQFRVPSHPLPNHPLGARSAPRAEDRPTDSASCTYLPVATNERSPSRARTRLTENGPPRHAGIAAASSSDLESAGVTPHHCPLSGMARAQASRGVDQDQRGCTLPVGGSKQNGDWHACHGSYDPVATSTSAATPLMDAPGWSHHWGKGGPMLLAKLTSRWSHPPGEPTSQWPHAPGGRHSPTKFQQFVSETHGQTVRLTPGVLLHPFLAVLSRARPLPGRMSKPIRDVHDDMPSWNRWPNGACSSPLADLAPSPVGVRFPPWQ
jgi:hypothetical protein